MNKEEFEQGLRVFQLDMNTTYDKIEQLQQDFEILMLKHESFFKEVRRLLDD